MLPLTSSHWGTYQVEIEAGQPTVLKSFPEDLDPSPIGASMLETRTGPCRISQPMVRRGFLEEGIHNDRSGRGREEFVPVDWEQALNLVARELDRVRDHYSHSAMYAGSYGWASAGRFHHAQSQLRRFMNLYGGCTTSRDSYSYAAAEVILPHVVAPMASLLEKHTSWRSIIESGKLVVAFGGMALRNSQMNAGGVGAHSQAQEMLAARKAGVEFINISPCNSDVSSDIEAEWISIRPNTDVALMLALAHTLVIEDLHDHVFLARYCTGFDRFLPYLMGSTDGTVKDADWAAGITGIPADIITALARRMASTQTLVNGSWSLTRQQNGEQPIWMLVVLAAMLGGIGQPGTGFGLGLGAVNGIGSERGYLPWAALPVGRNPINEFIPVARLSDMLLNPVGKFQYDGREYTYPDIRLVYWVGGNPFHHHQDINRLMDAWRRIETVIVHEPFWTATARQADIVLPSTVGLERNDLAASTRDGYLIAMQRVAEPFGMARNDHDIFADLACRLRAKNAAELNFKEAFTAGRSEKDWLRYLYEESRQRGEKFGQELPDFDSFWTKGTFKLALPREPSVMLKDFYVHPEENPLTTPSGLIEIFSESIASFDINGNPGHPVWLDPDEWLGSSLTQKYPLHLVTHQPSRRLHSQLDHGGHSLAGKIKGREPCHIHPTDAQARGIDDGDLVHLFNNRGSCIAAAKVDGNLRPGVMMLATGAWHDPDWENDRNRCKHGNPNVLTRDFPTSPLASGPSALTCLVEIERLPEEAPKVTIHQPPPIATMP
jgi:biotin/methionine sulfoxide reductase